MLKNILQEQKELTDLVRSIIDGVSRKGDTALIEYTKLFDSYELQKESICLSKSEIKYLLFQLKDEVFKTAVGKAAKNIGAFHNAEYKKLVRSWFRKGKEIKTGQFYNPVEKVGVYVPGGRFSYPSTVLMTVIPAKIAGVGKVVMATPPRNITPAVIYAAKIAGVDEIYRVGGAQAVGAMAFGTASVEQVDMIVGPGNKYVNEAKRQVFGTVGIDSLAGPSEVAIIADETANIEYIKADLLAQIEHDPEAVAYFFTTSMKLYEDIKEFSQSNKTESGSLQIHSTKVNAIAEAIDNVNKVAPEHLELMVKNPGRYLKDIRHAGAVFVGQNTPTALGDYFAGPSHVLPTAGAARFSGGLSTATFMKKTSYIEVTKRKQVSDSKLVEKLAETEGLNYHKLSIKVRD
jgi:histidinol dehydrogenase